MSFSSFSQVFGIVFFAAPIDQSECRFCDMSASFRRIAWGAQRPRAAPFTTVAIAKIVGFSTKRPKIGDICVKSQSGRNLTPLGFTTQILT